MYMCGEKRKGNLNCPDFMTVMKLSTERGVCVLGNSCQLHSNNVICTLLMWTIILYYIKLVKSSLVRMFQKACISTLFQSYTTT